MFRDPPPYDLFYFFDGALIDVFLLGAYIFGNMGNLPRHRLLNIGERY